MRLGERKANKTAEFLQSSSFSPPSPPPQTLKPRKLAPLPSFPSLCKLCPAPSSQLVNRDFGEEKVVVKEYFGEGFLVINVHEEGKSFSFA